MNSQSGPKGNGERQQVEETMRNDDQLRLAKKSIEADIAAWTAEDALRPDGPVHTDEIKAWRDALAYVNDQLSVMADDD